MRARGPSTLLPLIQDASAPEPQGLAIFSLGALLAIPSEEDKAAVGARRTLLSVAPAIETIAIVAQFAAWMLRVSGKPC